MSIGIKLLILPMAFTAMQGARLEIADAVTGLQSSSALAVEIRVEGAAIAGVQFDLECPNIVAVSILPGAATRNALKQVYQSEFLPGRKRVLITAMNRTLIDDGTVVVLYVSSIGSVPADEYAFLLSNAVAVDTDGNPVQLDLRNGVLRMDSAMPDTPLQAGGILNSASFLPGPIAAGELVTLLGARLDSPDVMVTFNGIPSPVLFSSSAKLNTLVPLSLDGGEARIAVLQGDNGQSEVTVPVAVAAPGIFTEDGSGAGPAIVVLEDGTRSSVLNPALAGTVITAYATGLRPAAELTARMGDAEAVVSGIVPEETTPGLVQIRIRVPEGISGAALPLVISASGISSQTGVTVAIAPPDAVRSQ